MCVWSRHTHQTEALFIGIREGSSEVVVSWWVITHCVLLCCACVFAVYRTQWTADLVLLFYVHLCLFCLFFPSLPLLPVMSLSVSLPPSLRIVLLVCPSLSSSVLFCFPASYVFFFSVFSKLLGFCLSHILILLYSFLVFCVV